jgi:hypothetical protein
VTALVTPISQMYTKIDNGRNGASQRHFGPKLHMASNEIEAWRRSSMPFGLKIHQAIAARAPLFNQEGR